MNACPQIKLGELLRQIDRTERVDPDSTYRLLGVRLEGNGPFIRETVSGTETSAVRLNAVRARDFIYSRLFAWRGAFGVINEALDGCFVSNEFPIFQTDAHRLDVDYLARWFLLSSVWRRVESNCTGSTPTTRNRFKEKFFFDLEIPLPPLAEQQALVARLDALAEKTRQVETHLDAVERDSLRLLVTMATRYDLTDEKRRVSGWRPASISDLATLAPYPEAVAINRSYPNVGILSYAKGVFGKAPIEGANTSAKTLYRIKSGQFIYSRLFAFEGAYALVPDEFNGYYVSNEFPTFEVNDDLASPKFLMALFMTEADWHKLRASTKGVGDRRLRIQPEHILARRIWLPPQHEVARIVALFDLHVALKAKHAAIRKANATLLPATLERVFAGGD